MFYLIKKLFLSFTLFSNLISQIIYCVIHRCLYSLFIYTFFVLLYQFWRDCIFKVTWCNQFKFSVFGNIKRVFRWFAFIQANIFLKLKRILTKINISWVKSWRARPAKVLGCEVANINALFCWMNHHCWMWLLSDIVAWDSF